MIWRRKRKERRDEPAGLRPLTLFMNSPHDATVNLAASILKQGAQGTLQVGLSSVEPPSAIWALSQTLRQLDPSGKIALGVAAVAEPDPRKPIGRVDHLLWVYKGTIASPGLPTPAEPVRTAIHEAVRVMDDQWMMRALRVGQEMGGAGIADLLACMVRPGQAPEGRTPWEWLRSVQAAAAIAIIASEGGWIGSRRRAAVLSAVYGPLDWAGGAALAAAAFMAAFEPAIASEIPPILRHLRLYRPSEGAHPFDHLVEALASSYNVTLPDPLPVGDWMRLDALREEITHLTAVIEGADESARLAAWQEVARACPDDPAPQILLAGYASGRGNVVDGERLARHAWDLLRAGDPAAPPGPDGLFTPLVRVQTANLAGLVLSEALRNAGRYGAQADVLQFMAGWSPQPTYTASLRISALMFANREDEARAVLDEVMARSERRLGPWGALWLSHWHRQLRGTALPLSREEAEKGLETTRGSARHLTATPFGATLAGLLPALAETAVLAAAAAEA